MEKRPIGVFDSGLGGLTAVRELRDAMPGEDIVYFGDTARVPYGNRSRETIRRFAVQDLQFLLQYQPKAILVACGTISANAMDVLQKHCSVPLFGVVEPTAEAAAKATKNGKIGVLGTQATVSSGVYERLIREKNPQAQVISQACPLFVPLVENGMYDPADALVRLTVARYIAPLLEAGVDTVVLGCTHYPFLEEALQQAFGADVLLLNSGREGARKIVATFPENIATAGKFDCYVTDRVPQFAQVAEQFLNMDITKRLHAVSLEDVE